DIVLVADALWRDRDPEPQSRVRDLVKCAEPFTTKYLDDDEVALTAIGHDFAAEDIQGEWIGLAKFTEQGSNRVRAEIEAMKNEDVAEQASMIDLFSRLLSAGEDIRVIYIPGHWLDIDNADDLADAQKFL
ncbi:MAG: phosphoenolpyruvate mutase, partial [Rhodospirillaceae bacterium]|nr:phosphoenolpyruvate mutase [Rhodospirillaceae bacterium]